MPKQTRTKRYKRKSLRGGGPVIDDFSFDEYLDPLYVHYTRKAKFSNEYPSRQTPGYMHEKALRINYLIQKGINVRDVITNRIKNTSKVTLDHPPSTEIYSEPGSNSPKSSGSVFHGSTETHSGFKVPYWGSVFHGSTETHSGFKVPYWGSIYSTMIDRAPGQKTSQPEEAVRQNQIKYYQGFITRNQKPLLIEILNKDIIIGTVAEEYLAKLNQ